LRAGCGWFTCTVIPRLRLRILPPTFPTGYHTLFRCRLFALPRFYTSWFVYPLVTGRVLYVTYLSGSCAAVLPTCTCSYVTYTYGYVHHVPATAPRYGFGLPVGLPAVHLVHARFTLYVTHTTHAHLHTVPRLLGCGCYFTRRLRFCCPYTLHVHILRLRTWIAVGYTLLVCVCSITRCTTPRYTHFATFGSRLYVSTRLRFGFGYGYHTLPRLRLLVCSTYAHTHAALHSFRCVCHAHRRTRWVLHRVRVTTVALFGLRYGLRYARLPHAPRTTFTFARRLPHCRARYVRTLILRFGLRLRLVYSCVRVGLRYVHFVLPAFVAWLRLRTAPGCSYRCVTTTRSRRFYGTFTFWFTFTTYVLLLPDTRALLRFRFIAHSYVWFTFFVYCHAVYPLHAPGSLLRLRCRSVAFTVYGLRFIPHDVCYVYVTHRTTLVLRLGYHGWLRCLTARLHTVLLRYVFAHHTVLPPCRLPHRYAPVHTPLVIFHVPVPWIPFSRGLPRTHRGLRFALPQLVLTHVCITRLYHYVTFPVTHVCCPVDRSGCSVFTYVGLRFGLRVPLVWFGCWFGLLWLFYRLHVLPTPRSCFGYVLRARTIAGLHCVTARSHGLRLPFTLRFPTFTFPFGFCTVTPRSAVTFGYHSLRLLPRYVALRLVWFCIGLVTPRVTRLRLRLLVRTFVRTARSPRSLVCSVTAHTRTVLRFGLRRLPFTLRFTFTRLPLRLHVGWFLHFGYVGCLRLRFRWFTLPGCVRVPRCAFTRFTTPRFPPPHTVGGYGYHTHGSAVAAGLLRGYVRSAVHRFRCYHGYPRWFCGYVWLHVVTVLPRLHTRFTTVWLLVWFTVLRLRYVTFAFTRLRLRGFTFRFTFVAFVVLHFTLHDSVDFTLFPRLFYGCHLVVRYIRCCCYVYLLFITFGWFRFVALYAPTFCTHCHVYGYVYVTHTRWLQFWFWLHAATVRLLPGWLVYVWFTRTRFCGLHHHHAFVTFCVGLPLRTPRCHPPVHGLRYHFGSLPFGLRLHTTLPRAPRSRAFGWFTHHGAVVRTLHTTHAVPHHVRFYVTHVWLRYGLHGSCVWLPFVTVGLHTRYPPVTHRVGSFTHCTPHRFARLVVCLFRLVHRCSRTFYATRLLFGLPVYTVHAVTALHLVRLRLRILPGCALHTVYPWFTYHTRTLRWFVCCTVVPHGFWLRSFTRVRCWFTPLRCSHTTFTPFVYTHCVARLLLRGYVGLRCYVYGWIATRLHICPWIIRLRLVCYTLALHCYVCPTLRLRCYIAGYTFTRFTRTPRCHLHAHHGSVPCLPVCRLRGYVWRLGLLRLVYLFPAPAAHLRLLVWLPGLRLPFAFRTRTFGYRLYTFTRAFIYVTYHGCSRLVGFCYGYARLLPVYTVRLPGSGCTVPLPFVGLRLRFGSVTYVLYVTATVRRWFAFTRSHHTPRARGLPTALRSHVYAVLVAVHGLVAAFGLQFVAALRLPLRLFYRVYYGSFTVSLFVALRLRRYGLHTAPRLRFTLRYAFRLVVLRVHVRLFLLLPHTRSTPHFPTARLRLVCLRSHTPLRLRFTVTFTVCYAQLPVIYHFGLHTVAATVTL